MAKIIKSVDVSPEHCAPYEHLPFDDPSDSFSEDQSGADAPPDPQALIEAAQAEIEATARRVYAEAREKAETEVEARFAEQVDQCEKAFGSVVHAIQESNETYLAELEASIKALTSAIAKRVLRREVQTEPELILTAVRCALNELVDRRKLVLQVNIDDFELVRGIRESLLQEFDGIGSIEILPNADVDRGGCVVESETLHIDARLDVQLDNVLNDLFGR